MFCSTKTKRRWWCDPTGLGGSYTIPNGVTTILDFAFAFSRVTSVVIPASVTTAEGTYAS